VQLLVDNSSRYLVFEMFRYLGYIFKGEGRYFTKKKSETLSHINILNSETVVNLYYSRGTLSKE
jgi:hypothetical protein